MLSFLKKLNHNGFSHHLIMPIFVILTVGSIGAYVLTKSQAASVDYASYLTVNTTAVSTTLNRGNSNTLLMQRDQSGYTSGLIYGPGFTIHNKTAGGYTIYNSSGSQGVGFYESTGGMTNGQTIKIHTYINPNKPDGTYTGSALLKYYDTATSKWENGPTINYTVKLATGAYSKYITINGKHTVQTLSRSKAVGGFVYGTGITLNPVQNTAFTFYPNQVLQGKGYYEVSGGLATGQTFTPKTYLNTSFPNGTYTGSYVLKYRDSTGVYRNGPTVSFKLILTD